MSSKKQSQNPTPDADSLVSPFMKDSEVLMIAPITTKLTTWSFQFNIMLQKPLALRHPTLGPIEPVEKLDAMQPLTGRYP
jgi:hypothetical protein